MTVNTAADGSRDGGVGKHTTAPPPVDPAIIAPGIEQYLRTTVRLHPRAGDPGPHDSHIGGPMLWPSAQPWPTCRARDCDAVAEEIPMIALAQFTAADFPEIEFPDGADVAQIFQCPSYPEHPYSGAIPGRRT